MFLRLTVVTAITLTALSSTLTASTAGVQDKATHEKRVREFKVSIGDYHTPAPEATAKRLAGVLAWRIQTMVGAYDLHGRRNVTWDDAARKGLTMVARIDARDPSRPGDAADEAWYWLTKAVSLGCDDPMVQYQKAKLSRADLVRNQAAITMRDAALALEHSAYPAYWRGYGLIVAANSLATAGTGMSAKDYEPIWREACYMLDRSLTAWAEIAKDKSIPDSAVLDYINQSSDTWVHASRRDRKVGFPELVGAVKAARGANDPLVALITARFSIEYAWDARGHEYASEVVDSAWPAFEARLNDAEKAVGEALKLGSSDPSIPRLMMRIAGSTDGDLNEIEPWFRAGMAADPGDRTIYEAELDWLLPQWYGSVEELEDYVGRARATGNWNLRLPLLVVEMHDDLSKLTPNWKLYFKEPQVCGDLAPVYEEFLKRYPDAGFDRGIYAVRLTYCGRWAEAKKQLDAIAPDRLRVSAFGGQAAYENLLLSVAAHLK